MKVKRENQEEFDALIPKSRGRSFVKKLRRTSETSKREREKVRNSKWKQPLQLRDLLGPDFDDEVYMKKFNFKYSDN